MRIIRIGIPGEERPAVMIDNTTAIDVSSCITDIDQTFWLEGGAQTLRAILRDGGDRLPHIDLSGIRIGPPIVRPYQVLCIGLNYADHAAESGMKIPPEPIVFNKSPGTVVGPNDDVLLPINGRKTDWEVELAVIIGKRARYLQDEQSALDCIGGYTISNDVSEREFQLERGGQWVKGKSCETFNPLGPWLVTPDDIPDVSALDLSLSVNGSPVQSGSSATMIFGVGYLVWYLSQFLVLEPGDIVNTGTPPGVGMGMTPPRYLQDGDLMDVWISGLGHQRQRVRPAQA